MNSHSIRAIVTRSILIVALLASVAGAQSITTLFAQNNGLAGNMFDVSTFGSSVIINNFDVNLDAGTFTVDVWAVTGGGSFEPVHTNAAAWTLIGSNSVVSAGTDMPTNLGLNLGYLVPPVTTQGFYITATTGSPTNYTNGTNGGGIYVQDSFLAIREGIGKGIVTGYPTVFSTTVGGGTLPFPSASSRIWNGTIYYTPVTGLADDLFLATISAPVDAVACEFLGSTEAITATFVNIGSNTVLNGSLIQMDAVIDGGPPITEFLTLPNDLALGDTFTYTFTATADLSAPGSHTVAVTVFLGGDLDPTNDSKSKVVQSGSATTVSTFPWIETFDSTPADNTISPPLGWTQDQSDGSGTYSDWYFKTGTTSTANTGPNGDHTGGGFYAYTEDSGNFAQTNLDSPCLDLTALIAPQLSFWFHSFNATTTPLTTQNFLSVDVISYPGGTVTTDVFGPLGHQAAASWAASTWNQASVSLAPFAGQLIQVRFRSQTSGGGSSHDIAIDDIGVFEPVPTPGQAPQPGLAVFDIDGAINGNLAPISSGLGGPYYSTVTQGAPFGFHFEAEPFQPIAVVYGPLNPVAATYPGGIGQFDIGGPGVDPNGIPLNLAVFVNAIGWVQGGAIGFPFDALFFTKTSGMLDLGLAMPPFGIPAGTVLTTFQAAITSSAPPFVYLSNAIQVTLN